MIVVHLVNHLVLIAWQEETLIVLYVRLDIIWMDKFVNFVIRLVKSVQAAPPIVQNVKWDII